MDAVHDLQAAPGVVRAQVIYQNYVCFVYLGEACFRALRQIAPSGSNAKKCCKFLTDNPIRAFRNAIAHANWDYNDDFSGIIYWARKGSDPSEPMSRFEVAQHDLQFWQALARTVGYVTYTHLNETNSEQGSGGNR